MWTLVASLLVAPPPLGEFPAAVAPAAGTNAPANTAFFAMGKNAPSPDLVGISLIVDGDAGPALSFERFGCCALVAVPPAPLPVGATVAATIASASGDLNTTVTIVNPDDEAPVLAVAPAALDDGPSADGTAWEIVIGAEAADNTAPALLLAKQGETLVGVSSASALLLARIPGTQAPGPLCVDVSAMDVAQNVSSSSTVCVDIEEPPPPPDGGDEDDDDDDHSGCAATGAHPGRVAVLGLLLAVVRRRRRT